jgi:hypothetical protein
MGENFAKLARILRAFQGLERPMSERETLPSIRLDMFEVQLGAAILLTFRTEDGIVRVLADAGVKASGYAADHVLRKLNPIFGDGPRHIDLIIGTHYDEDHLIGLVPIIEDETITIGEAWMPPVANDLQSFPVDQPVAVSDLLAHQFRGDGGKETLAAYLEAKRQDILAVTRVARDLAGQEGAGESDDESKLYFHRDAPRGQANDPHDLTFFRAQLGEAGGDYADHGFEQELEAEPLVDEMVAAVRRGSMPDWRFSPYGPTQDLVVHAKWLNAEQPQTATAQAASLANIGKGAAKDAINAKALHDVVQALGARSIPVRTEIIEDGMPRTYRWERTDRRFLLSKLPVKGLRLTLLGPSRSLVKKHRDRLPVMEATKVALMFRGEVRSITASNQLSYVGCFGALDQMILIAGDAGCVDFSNGPDSYYPRLIDALVPLHVIQVAHHGGNNAHFYRVLAAAGYPEQVAQSYLLLSHAWHDKTRPSDVFHDFLLSTLGHGDDVKLLFTSEPTRDKVVDYLGAIYPVVGPPDKVGDVSMDFANGRWSVTKHAIGVA